MTIFNSNTVYSSDTIFESRAMGLTNSELGLNAQDFALTKQRLMNFSCPTTLDSPKPSSPWRSGAAMSDTTTTCSPNTTPRTQSPLPPWRCASPRSQSLPPAEFMEEMIRNLDSSRHGSPVLAPASPPPSPPPSPPVSPRKMYSAMSPSTGVSANGKRPLVTRLASPRPAILGEADPVAKRARMDASMALNCLKKRLAQSLPTPPARSLTLPPAASPFLRAKKLAIAPAKVLYTNVAVPLTPNQPPPPPPTTPAPATTKVAMTNRPRLRRHEAVSAVRKDKKRSHSNMRNMRFPSPPSSPPTTTWSPPLPPSVPMKVNKSSFLMEKYNQQVKGFPGAPPPPPSPPSSSPKRFRTSPPSLRLH